MGVAAGFARGLPAVGSQIEVLVDRGIRRGSDIVKAVCLRTRAVLVEGVYAYGLAAAGERESSGNSEKRRRTNSPLARVSGNYGIIYSSYLDTHLLQ